MRFPARLLALLLCCVPAYVAASTVDEVVHRDEPALQRIANRLRKRLAIRNPVVVRLVPRNPLVASVQPSKEIKGTFLLSVERGFIEGLSTEELEAVLAHELGHVWIYTHHPYLQTEQLANRIAMRVVGRETLAQVYGKVWGATAMEGSLASFLGLPATPSATTAAGLAPGPPARITQDAARVPPSKP